MALSKAEATDRLTRFQGGPGTTKGLQHDEMLELFQHLIDTGEAYTLNDGTQYHIEAWAENGDLTGFDASKMIR